MFRQFKLTNKANAVGQSRIVGPFFTVSPNALPPFLSLSREKGLLSALTLGHQAAVVAAATNLRVLGQGGRRGRGKK